MGRQRDTMLRQERASLRNRKRQLVRPDLGDLASQPVAVQREGRIAATTTTCSDGCAFPRSRASPVICERPVARWKSSRTSETGEPCAVIAAASRRMEPRSAEPLRTAADSRCGT